MHVQKVKRVVIKEELVALVGDYKKAVILNQFIYWSERVKDFDKFIEEENSRREKEELTTMELQHGWIYKTSEELSEEIMMGMSPSTVRRQIKPLIESGYIEERTNPTYKWDQTIQYRVQLAKISHDLQQIGYHLEGYKALITPNFQNENSKVQHEHSNDQNENAIPEITSEITSETFSIDLTINGVRIATTMEELIADLGALDKKSSLYNLTAYETRLLITQYREHAKLLGHERSESTLSTDDICRVAPVAALLAILNSDHKKRKKIGLPFQSMATSLNKCIITYIKVFSRLPKPAEILHMDEKLSQKDYTPSVVGRGFRYAKEKGFTGEMGKDMMTFIDEVKEMDAMNKLHHAKEKYENRKSQKPYPKSKHNPFRDLPEYEAF